MHISARGRAVCHRHGTQFSGLPMRSFTGSVFSIPYYSSFFVLEKTNAFKATPSQGDRSRVKGRTVAAGSYGDELLE